MNHFGFQDTILLCGVYAQIVCYLKLLKHFSNANGLASLAHDYSNAIYLANYFSNANDILANDFSYSNDLVSCIFLSAFLLFHSFSIEFILLMITS